MNPPVDKKFIAQVCAFNLSGQFFYQLSYLGEHCGALFPVETNGVKSYEHYGVLGCTPYRGKLEEVVLEAVESELAAQAVTQQANYVFLSR